VQCHNLPSLLLWINDPLFLQKRPWTLQTFLHLSHAASAAWNLSNASFYAHESVGRLNLEFDVVARLLMKKGAEYGAFEQLPRKKEHYFQVCSSKLMRCMLPNWYVLALFWFLLHSTILFLLQLNLWICL
jgi:hypothetical protein